MRVFLLLTLFLCAPISVPVAVAETQATLEARQKINLSGRQRMLIQRMSAAACLVMANTDRDARIAVVEATYGEFARTLHGLTHGDRELGLGVETNDAVLAALKDVKDTWDEFNPAIQQLATGDSHTVVVQ